MTSGDCTPTETEDAGFRRFPLSEALLRALTAGGFERPTPIQAKAIPAALAGRDLLARAPTGTGKTLAFSVPALERLSRGRSEAKRAIRIVVLAPTRELALQIRGVIEPLAESVGLSSVALVGGLPLRSDVTALRRGPQIVVATPGRLLDHIEHRTVDLSHTAIVVLDEADRMLDLGFLPQVYRILNVTPASRQTLLFSATIPTDIANLAKQHMRNPIPIEIGAAQRVAERAEQSVLYLAIEQKLPALIALLRAETGTCLVFVATKVKAEELHRATRAAGLPVAALHGDLTQAARMKALEMFQDESARILIATDVAGRGLDVEQIAHVVNYDTPLRPDDYIHRVGRTARADASGKATTFVSYDELENLSAIQRHLRHSIPLGIYPDGIPVPPWATTVKQFDSSVLAHEGTFAPQGFRIARRRR
ncbi:MAG: DEAD/DEAH box helicase [Planctomycetes bacterium]|nr:DEAD/DEAH box helicase [Planctomycetota bacterium]